MNRASDWFKKTYGDVDVTRIIIIPTKTVGRNAALRDPALIMRAGKLEALRRNVRAFFMEFANADLRDLLTQRVQDLLATHKLDVDQLVAAYASRRVCSVAPSRDKPWEAEPSASTRRPTQRRATCQRHSPTTRSSGRSPGRR
jgi:hypothetical protein